MRSRAEYILELVSNCISLLVSWKMRPSENAPRMLDMVEPMVFPIARDGRPWARDATTTASYHDVDQVGPALRS